MRGTISVAAITDRLQPSSRVVSRVRRDMSVISAFERLDIASLSARGGAS